MAQIDQLFQAAVGPYRPWQVVRTDFDATARRLDLYLDVPRGPASPALRGTARLPGSRHRAKDLAAPGLLPVPRLPAGCRRAAADALRCLLARLTSAAQPSSTASMARMNRCSAWSTAITPHSMVANPGLPAARMSAHRPA